MKTIVELAEYFNTDKKMDNGKPAINGLPGHNYAEIYDKYLKDFKVDRMLEIGIAQGASIKMWDEYFNRKAEIHGIDIKEIASPYFNITCHHGDQKDIDWLNREFAGMEFDLIIDDGSHRMRDQQISLKTLFPKLRSGGLYVIEDLHTSYIADFWSDSSDKERFSTTVQILSQLKLNMLSQNFNYLNKNEFDNLYNNIQEINVYTTKNNYIIGFIAKK